MGKDSQFQPRFESSKICKIFTLNYCSLVLFFGFALFLVNLPIKSELDLTFTGCFAVLYPC